MTDEMKVLTYLYMTTSLKGGTAKSLFASVLLDTLRAAGISIAAFDADGSIGSLSMMYAEKDENGVALVPQDPLTGVVSYNIRDESRDMLIDSAQQHQGGILLHDLAGGALMDMMRISDDQNSFRKLFETFNYAKIRPIFFHLVTSDKASVESVAIHLDLIDALGESGKQARHIAVINQRGGLRDDDFPFWFGFTDHNGVAKGGMTRKRLLAAGGAEMKLPHINERTLALAKDLGIPLSKAVTDSRLRMADQQRVRNFLTDFELGLSDDVRRVMGVPV